MEKIKLNVNERENLTPNALRRENKIPATLYGPGEPSKNLQIDAREFSRLPHAAFSHMIELSFTNGGSTAPTNALIRHVQHKASTGKIMNVELYRVRLDRKLTVTVPLEFVGASEAAVQGGQLIESYQEAEIECFPNDIPDSIQVDLSKLKEIDDAIHFGDIVISEKVKILNPHDDVVVKVVTPREMVVEEEAPAAAAEGAVPTVEGEAAAAPAAAETAEKPEKTERK